MSISNPKSHGEDSPDTGTISTPSATKLSVIASQSHGSEKVLRATHGSPDRPLRIEAMEIPCYVLEDGTRVLSGRGMQSALLLGQSRGALVRGFFNRSNIREFVSEAMRDTLDNPIRFIRPGRGGKLATGYEATILADMCDVVLAARQAGVLGESEKDIAEHCEILTRSFAKVGIIALVDEATGYQEYRAKDALAEILNLFISKELAKWAKTFPDEFYAHLFRLRNWQYSQFSTKRPVVAGRITNDIVYERLAPGVLDELRRLTPRDDKGRLKHKQFQRLTDDVGVPRLKEHLASVIALMKASSTWRKFYSMLNRALPKFGAQRVLDGLDMDDDDD